MPVEVPIIRMVQVLHWCPHQIVAVPGVPLPHGIEGIHSHGRQLLRTDISSPMLCQEVRQTHVVQNTLQREGGSNRRWMQ